MTPLPNLDRSGPKKSWSPSNGRASNGDRPKPIDATTVKPATSARMRIHRRGTRAMTIASIAASEKCAPRAGCSSPCHPVAIRTAGSSARSAGLTVRNGTLRAAEDSLEVVPPPHDGDRDAGRFQPKQAGVGARGPPTAAGEGRGVDEDDRDLLPRRGPADQGVDGRRAELGRHDDEVAGMADAAVLAEQRLDGPPPRLLGRRQQFERARPVAFVRTDRDGIRIHSARNDETGVAAPAGMRPEQRSGGANLSVEARLARRPRSVSLLRVEDDDDLVARRILQLLDHELLPAGGRRPVDAAERLAALVLPDAVELEARGPPQEDATRTPRAQPAFGEQRLQADEPWIDEQRRRVGQRLDDARQPERILDDGTGAREAVAAARNPDEPVDGAQEAPVPADDHLAATESARLLLEHGTRRHQAAVGLQLDPDDEVLALDRPVAVHMAEEPQGAREDARPDDGGEDGEEHPDGRNVEDVGAERPGGEVRASAQRQREAAAAGHHRAKPGRACARRPRRSAPSRRARPLALPGRGSAGAPGPPRRSP